MKRLLATAQGLTPINAALALEGSTRHQTNDESGHAVPICNLVIDGKSMAGAFRIMSQRTSRR